MRTDYRKFVMLAVLLAVVIAPIATAQVKVDQYYKIQTKQVAIPVYVIDADGKPVDGLTAADFSVLDENQNANVRAVQFIDHWSADWEDYAVLPPESRRQFLFLFDLYFTNPHGLRQAVDASIDFISSKVSPNDLVAVATISKRGGVGLLSPFTTRHSQVIHSLSNLNYRSDLKVRDPLGFAYDGALAEIEAMNSDANSAATMSGGSRAGDLNAELVEQLEVLGTLLKDMDDRRFAGTVTQYVKMLQSLAVGMSEQRGRKNVVFFSAGFDNEVMVGGNLEALDRESQAMMNPSSLAMTGSANRSGALGLQRLMGETLEDYGIANTVFYVIDTNRLGGALGDGNARRRTQDSLFRFAEETNGEVFANTNDISASLGAVADRTASGYLVLFDMPAAAEPGEYRKIRISASKGKKIDHQPGYLVPKNYAELTPQERSFQVAQWVATDQIFSDFEMDMHVEKFGRGKKYAQIPVIVEVSGENIIDSGKMRSEPITLDVYTYLLDMDNRPLDFAYAELKYETKEAREKLKARGIKYFDSLVSEAGDYKIKCIIRDRELGLTAVKIKTVSIPNYEEKPLVISGPVIIDMLADWTQETSIGSPRIRAIYRGKQAPLPYVWGERNWLPAANAVVTINDPLLVYISVLGLTIEEQSQKPQIDLKFETVDEQGNAKTVTGLVVSGQNVNDELETIEFMFQIKLDDLGLKAGLHQLRCAITDKITGVVTVGHTNFTVND